MAKTTYNIDIDGTISEYYYSKGFVKYMLDKAKGNPVKVRMNSLGGSLDHGLGIKDRFQEHGDVEVDMFGFNASAATLASLGAKKTNISKSGFYLIHKVMNWVDIWGSKNADELAVIIADLEASKKDNEKMDLVIAQLYADKTGKPINELIDLMKTGGWLNAKEAIEWGFVDGYVAEEEKGKTNLANMEEKFNAMGIPTNRITTENLFTSNNINKMTKQPIKVNAVIGVDQLESDADGVFLNEVQLESLETRITELENSVTTAAETVTVAEARANTAEATVATQTATIADLTTQVENLKKGPGDGTGGIKKPTDEGGKTDETENEFSNTITASRALFDRLPN